jgi:hypothetical protein
MSAYNVFVFAACGAVSVLVFFMVLAGLSATMLSSRLSRIEERERGIGAGVRVRFLCAIPEQNIEAGEQGRVVMIYPGDDREYWIQPDRNIRKRVKFFEDELWQLEVVE